MADNQETEMVDDDLERGVDDGKQQQQQGVETLYSPKTAMHFISKSLSSRFNSARDQAHEKAFLTIRVKQGQRSNSNLVELDFSHGSGNNETNSSGRSFDSTELLNKVGTGANNINSSLSSNNTTTVGVGGSSEIVLYSHKSSTERVQIAVDSVGFSIKTSNKANDLSSSSNSNSGGNALSSNKSKVNVDKNGMRHVLKDISGIHDAGRMLAILGPSGAGKTTLLNILGGNLRQTSGQIMLNGEEAYSPTDITELSAFVHQDDCLLPTMTVKETILFAAHMRLPYSMSNSKKAQRAANAISLLGLKKCQHTMIGSTVEGTRGVSGGERKRCAIATELLTNPSVIFLDEPSSGLDAYAAFSLGSVLKTLCHLGKTVVMTIHQPSSDLYDLFDDMLLLANGQTVFWGPSANSVQYFAQMGYSCPPFCNPCDYFFLHVLNVSSPSGDMKLQQLHEAWRTSGSSKATKKGISHLLADNENTIKDIILSQKAGVPCLRKMSLLTRRGFKHFFRNKMLLPSRLLQALLSSLVAMAVFWGVTDNQTGIMARSGVLFYFAANTLFSSVLSVLSAFSSERSVFMREYSNGAYSVFVYFFSKILVEYPFQILIPILVSASSYFAVGLQAHVANFFVFCTCLVLVNLVGTNIGLMLSSAFSDVSIALSLAPLFVLPLMLFSGFFISYDDTPAYVAWIQAISPVRYAFAALMQNEFDGLELHCTASQVIPTGIPGLDICPIENGSQYIDLYGYNLLDVTRCIVMLGILLVCSLLVAYMTLFVSAAKSRGRSLFCFSTYFNHN
jgi:ATP-binding cassette subfamily G (WHITE) protein 1